MFMTLLNTFFNGNAFAVFKLLTTGIDDKICNFVRFFLRF